MTQGTIKFFFAAFVAIVALSSPKMAFSQSTLTIQLVSSSGSSSCTCNSGSACQVGSNAMTINVGPDPRCRVTVTTTSPSSPFTSGLGDWTFDSRITDLQITIVSTLEIRYLPGTFNLNAPTIISGGISLGGSPRFNFKTPTASLQIRSTTLQSICLAINGQATSGPTASITSASIVGQWGNKASLTLESNNVHLTLTDVRLDISDATTSFLYASNTKPKVDFIRMSGYFRYSKTKILANSNGLELSMYDCSVTFSAMDTAFILNEVDFNIVGFKGGMSGGGRYGSLMKTSGGARLNISNLNGGMLTATQSILIAGASSKVVLKDFVSGLVQGTDAPTFAINGLLDLTMTNIAAPARAISSANVLVAASSAKISISDFSADYGALYDVSGDAIIDITNWNSDKPSYPLYQVLMRSGGSTNLKISNLTGTLRANREVLKIDGNNANITIENMSGQITSYNANVFQAARFSKIFVKNFSGLISGRGVIDSTSAEFNIDSSYKGQLIATNDNLVIASSSANVTFKKFSDSKISFPEFLVYAPTSNLLLS